MDIPEELQFRDISRAPEHVIVSKEQRQVLPQNGTQFTQGSAGSTQIVFRLPSDDNTSVDMSSIWITANLQINGLPAGTFGANCTWLDQSVVDTIGPSTAAAYSRPFICTSDSIESMIRQLHILIAGSELERHDLYGPGVESMLNMHLNNANFSHSIGSGGMLANLSPYERCRLLIGNGATARTSSNVIQVCFPLRWAGSCNTRSLWPLYLMGQNALEMRLFLSNANEFLCAGALNFSDNGTTNYYGPATTFTPITTELSYTLSDVRMNYDVCMTSDSYNNALKSYLASSRLTLPIDTYYSTVFDLPQSSGWVNHTISTQMSDISAVYVGFVRGSEQSSYAFCGGDRFFKPIGLTEARIMINGRPLPNVNIRLSGNPVLPEAEAYHYLLKSLKQGSGTLEVVGNTNQYRDGIRTIVHASAAAAVPNREKSWLQSTGMAYGVQRVPPPTEGTGASAGIFTPNRWTNLSNPYAAFTTITTTDNWLSSDAHFWESPSQFILGFDTSKSNYASEYELAGTDLSRSSGLIQLQLKFDAAPSDMRAIILVRHKRLLDIGLESSQVIY